MEPLGIRGDGFIMLPPDGDWLFDGWVPDCWCIVRKIKSQIPVLDMTGRIPTFRFQEIDMQSRFPDLREKNGNHSVAIKQKSVTSIKEAAMAKEEVPLTERQHAEKLVVMKEEKKYQAKIDRMEEKVRKATTPKRKRKIETIWAVLLVLLILALLGWGLSGNISLNANYHKTEGGSTIEHQPITVVPDAPNNQPGVYIVNKHGRSVNIFDWAPDGRGGIKMNSISTLTLGDGDSRLFLCDSGNRRVLTVKDAVTGADLGKTDYHQGQGQVSMVVN